MIFNPIIKNARKQTIALCLWAIFLSATGTPPLFAQTPLKVGIYHNPPLVFMDEKGKAQGLYVDTLNTIAEKENWTLEYVHAQWVDLLEKAKQNDIDLITAIAYSPARDAWLDFNREAFAETWDVVYAPAGSSIRAMADLNGKRVAISLQDIHGGFFRQVAEAMGLEFTLVEETGYETAFQAVKNRRADVCVVSNGFGSGNACRYQLEATLLTFKPTRLGVAFPQGEHGGIAGAIDTYLSKWKNEPVWD